MALRDVVALASNVVAFAVVVLAAIALFVFRREIRGLLARVRRGKFPGIEIELAEQAQAVESAISKLEPPIELPATQTEHSVYADARLQVAAQQDAFLDRLLHQAAIAPEAAIVRINVELQQATRTLWGYWSQLTRSKFIIFVNATSALKQVKTEQLTAVGVPEASATTLVAAIAGLAKQVEELTTGLRKVIAMPASEPTVRALMFEYIDASIVKLKQLNRLSEILSDVLERNKHILGGGTREIDGASKRI